MQPNCTHNIMYTHEKLANIYNLLLHALKTSILSDVLFSNIYFFNSIIYLFLLILS